METLKIIKNGHHNRQLINGYKSVFGTLVENPMCSYITYSGYIKLIDESKDFNKEIKRLEGQLRRFIYKCSIELFPTIVPDRLFFELNVPEDTTLVSRYFEIQMDLFFSEVIDVKDRYIKDKHVVLLDLIQEFISENREFVTQVSRKS